MRENLIAVLLLIIAVIGWVTVVNANENNQVMKECVKNNRVSDDFQSIDFRKAAACYQDWKVTKTKLDYAEMRDFLKHNPRYRFPGQSMNKCWGKPREMPFKSAYIEKNGDGFRAGVTYKDKLPAGCYENGPWDNRDAQ